ncbi:MAG: hypothetical protein FWC41_10345 [Firmicutes bacterium]|nr:hypothetical protein [Bacillota bacterium]
MKNSELTDNIPNEVIKNGSIKIDFISENNTANYNTTVTIADKNGNNNLKQCDFCSKDYHHEVLLALNQMDEVATKLKKMMVHTLTK